MTISISLLQTSRHNGVMVIPGTNLGAEVVETPRAYAELAVHLAGALIRFVVAKSLELRPKEQKQAPVTAAAEDDVPF